MIDTSQMSVHELKRQISRHFTGGARTAPMEIELVSFGFRHGAPEAADLMIDVRFLPNPNFEPALRERTGLDAGRGRVRARLAAHARVHERGCAISSTS